MKFLEFFQEGSKLSNTRLINTLLVSFYLVWASYLVFTTDKIPDVPLQLAGLVVATYGVNKLAGKKTEEKQDKYKEYSI